MPDNQEILYDGDQQTDPVRTTGFDPGGRPADPTYEEPIERLELGTINRTYLQFKERFFSLAKKHLGGDPDDPDDGINFYYTNNYAISQGETLLVLPAITHSVISVVPVDSPKLRLRNIRHQSPNKEGAETRSWGIKKDYTIQFNCWGETEEQAEVAIQSLHDFFIFAAKHVFDLGLSDFYWSEDLIDIEVVRLQASYSVRSTQYHFIMVHSIPEDIDQIDSIHVVILDSDST